MFSVRGHVSAALKDLADQLIFGQPIGDTGEVGTALSALSIEGMTVAALFALNEQSALEFQRGSALHVLNGRGYTAPGVHMGRPGR